MAGGLFQQQPNLLSQILGGPLGGMMGGAAGGGALNSPSALAALAGIAAMAVKQMMGRR